MIYFLDKLTLLNSVFYDNEARCDHSVRIGNAREYTVNHSLIENGLYFQDAENNTGLVQNSIFLDRILGQWGPTKPSKLTIQNNLVNSNPALDSKTVLPNPETSNNVAPQQGPHPGDPEFTEVKDFWKIKKNNNDLCYIKRVLPEFYCKQ